jgi:beta-lactamase class A
MYSHLLYSRLILSLLLMLYGSVYSPAQDLNRRLESEIRQLVSGFKGEVGVYVKTLPTGKTVEINADTTFATASIVKVSLLMGIMDRI